MNTVTTDVEVIVTKYDNKDAARRAVRNGKDKKDNFKRSSSSKGGYKRTTRNNPRYNNNGE